MASTEVRLDLENPPACPQCGQGVSGWEWDAALAYHVPYAGPFGDGGTIIVPPGEKAPPGAAGADNVTPMKGMHRTTLTPCGHQFGKIEFFSRNGAVIRIEGEPYVAF